jgi:hypothetical protein
MSPAGRVGAILAIAVLLTTAACGGKAAGGSDDPPRLSVTDIDGFVLGDDEAPPGTDYIGGSSGTLSLEELWSSDCCLGVQDAFEDAGFDAAYGSFFEQPGHSADPIDARPGYELVSSTAVLFATSTGASQALDEWYGYYASPVLERVPTDGLGEEAVGVMGSPNAPAEVFFLYVWRIDRLVLGLRVSAGRGTVGLDDVRELVDRMDDRAS